MNATTTTPLNQFSAAQLTDLVDNLTDATRDPQVRRAEADLLKEAINASIGVPSPLSKRIAHWDVRLTAGASRHVITGDIVTDLGLPAWVLFAWASAPNPARLPYVLGVIRDGINARFPGLFDSALASAVAPEQQEG